MDILLLAGGTFLAIVGAVTMRFGWMQTPLGPPDAEARLSVAGIQSGMTPTYAKARVGMVGLGVLALGLLAVVVAFL